MKKKIDIKDCNAKKCATCIFNRKQNIITQERLGSIQQYLINGTNHICHTTDKICRGGRDFQLEIWSRLGIIEIPTDEALYKKNEEVMNLK